MVRWPVRKFARVGRPRSRSASSARISASASASAAAAVAAPRRDDVVEQPLRAGRAARRRARSVAVSASAASAIAAAQASIVFGVLSASSAALKPVEELGEPSGEVDRAALDVVEREDAAEQPLLVLGHGDADEEAVEPDAPGARGERLELERRSVRGVEPPADAAVGDPILDAGEVVVVEPEAAADRLAVGEVEHLRRGQPLVGEVEQLGDDAEHRVRLAERAVGEPDAQVGRATSAGNASSSSSSSKTSPAPKVAWISGANVSMSGHMTITSRGSSVWSSSSRWRIASRRPRPGGRGRGRRGPARCGRRVESGRSSARLAAAPGRRAGRPARRPGGARAACPSVLDGVVVIDVLGRPASTSCISRASCPTKRAAGCAGSAAVGSSAPAMTARARARRDPLPQRRRRVEQEEMDVAPAASARSTLRWPAGSRVRPKSESREAARRPPGSSRSRAHAPSSRSAGSGTPIRARSRRQSSACQQPSGRDRAVLARSPRPEPSPAGAARSGRTARRGGDGAEPPSPPRRIDVVAAAAQMRGQAAEPGLPEAPVDDLEQRPNRPLRQPRIRIGLDARRGRDRVTDEPARRRETRRSRTPRRPARPRAPSRPTSVA